MDPLSHSNTEPSNSYYRPPLGVFVLQSLFLYSDTTHPSPHSFQFAQAIFELNLFVYKYPNNRIPVILPAYTTYADGTGRAF
jgi:hypothetical protein